VDVNWLEGVCLNQGKSLRTLIGLSVLLLVSLGCWGQVLIPRSSAPIPVQPATNAPTIMPVVVPLAVPAGTPLKVALDAELRIENVGQPVQATIVEPVYAFDKLVIPAGSEVFGQVSAIEHLARKTRILAAMNADFSPYRQVSVEFDELRLPDGRMLPLHGTVIPGSQVILQFVTADHSKNGAGAGKNLVSKKVREARQQVRQEWDTAKRELHSPGKLHRVERMAIAQLPYHPQYLASGTAFSIDVNQPLDFGSESVKVEALSALGSPPPPGSTVHAALITPLSSATSRKDDSVEAVITQPLIADARLYIPEGSRLKGVVLRVRPARRLGRNGQLRIVFHQLVMPSGVEQQIQAGLEGVAVAEADHLVLDSEGGAQVTSPKSRYLSTGVALALAASSASPEHDHDVSPNSGDVGGAAAKGASGFKLAGTVVGALAHSRALAAGMGVYGASMSVYSHFLTRGRDVVYPKDTTMIIGLGPGDEHPQSPVTPEAVKHKQ